MKQKGRRVMSGIVSQGEDIFMSLEPWHGKCVSLMKQLKSLHVPFSRSGRAPRCFRAPLAGRKKLLDCLWENINHL